MTFKNSLIKAKLEKGIGRLIDLATRCSLLSFGENNLRLEHTITNSIIVIYNQSDLTIKKWYINEDTSVCMVLNEVERFITGDYNK